MSLSLTLKAKTTSPSDVKPGQVALAAWNLAVDHGDHGCETGVNYIQVDAVCGKGKNGQAKACVWQVINYYEMEDARQMLDGGKPVETIILWSDRELPCPGGNELIEEYVARHSTHHVIVFDYVWGQDKARKKGVSLDYLGAVLRVLDEQLRED
jgi:hypothetical protein